MRIVPSPVHSRLGLVGGLLGIAALSVWATDTIQNWQEEWSPGANVLMLALLFIPPALAANAAFFTDPAWRTSSLICSFCLGLPLWMGLSNLADWMFLLLLPSTVFLFAASVQAANERKYPRPSVVGLSIAGIAATIVALPFETLDHQAPGYSVNVTALFIFIATLVLVCACSMVGELWQARAEVRR